MAACVWVLNLDADLELAVGDAYTPSRAVLRRLPALRAAVMHLLGPDDVVCGDGDRADVTGRRGRAFCMTASARRRIEAAGAAPVAAPSVEIIRRVNHRRFSAELGQRLAGAVFAYDTSEIERALASMDAPLGALLKRPFGFSGRGQRRVSRTLSDADRAWLAATPVREGVQVEPRATLVVEHSVHGLLAEDGTLVLGGVVVQVCDDSGAWQDTRPATTADLDSGERAEAVAEARRVSRALAEASYFGPFGVDGFVYTDAAGVRRHQPQSEINARYTMGWSISTSILG